MDDRGTDVLAGQRERLVGFRPEFGVPAGVIEGVSEPRGQAGLLQKGLDELAASPFFRSQRGRGGGVERLGTDRLVESPDRLAAMLGAGPSGRVNPSAQLARPAAAVLPRRLQEGHLA